MKKIIHNVTFSNRDNYDCTYVILDSILRFYGYNTSQILHEEWSFFYRREKDGPFYISAKWSKIEDNFLRYGISVKSEQAPTPHYAWHHARQLLDDNQLVAPLADTYYLARYYYPGTGQHTPHYVILSGYDDEEETVHIVDPSPWKRFEGDLPLDGFKQAWSSPHLKSRNSWLEFKFPPYRHEDSTVTIKNILRRNIRIMFSEGSANQTLFGIEAIRAFAKDVGEWRKGGEDTAKAHMRRVFDYLQRVIVEREGHSEFLALAGAKLKSEGIVQISDELKAISQSWVVTRNMFFKGSKKEPLVMLPRIQLRLFDIADREEQALTALREVVRAWG